MASNVGITLAQIRAGTAVYQMDEKILYQVLQRFRRHLSYRYITHITQRYGAIFCCKTDPDLVRKICTITNI